MTLQNLRTIWAFPGDSVLYEGERAHQDIEGREPGPLGFLSVPKTAMSNQHLGRKERHVYYNAAQTAYLPGTYLSRYKGTAYSGKSCVQKSSHFRTSLPSDLTHVRLLGGRVQRSNVVSTEKAASDSGRAHALCHIFNVLNASQHSQPSEHLVSIHPASFNAPYLLISGSSFGTRPWHRPAGISPPSVPCICTVLAIVASSPTVERRPAVSPSTFRGNPVHCAGW